MCDECDERAELGAITTLYAEPEEPPHGPCAWCGAEVASYHAAYAVREQPEDEYLHDECTGLYLTARGWLDRL